MGSGGVGGFSKRGVGPRGVPLASGGPVRSSPRGNVLFPGEAPWNNALRASPPGLTAGCGSAMLGGPFGTAAVALAAALAAGAGAEEDAAAVVEGVVADAGVGAGAGTGATGAGADAFGNPAGVGKGPAPPCCAISGSNSGPYAGNDDAPPAAVVGVVVDSCRNVNAAFLSLQILLCRCPAPHVPFTSHAGHWGVRPKASRNVRCSDFMVPGRESNS